MSTRYAQEDKSNHEKQAEIESIEEIINDSGCEEEQTTLVIMIQIIKISLPIILTFISLSLLATFMFYLLSFETLQMTEGYSLTLLYFNCVVIGIFWGGTFGYQVLGSHALGKKRFEKISEYHYQVLVVSGLLGIIIALISVFIVPSLLELLHPDPVALGYLRSLMKSFAPAIVLFALFQTYMRLANIMHDTNICFYSSVVGCIIQAIVSYILFNKIGLGIHSIGIGYTVNFLYCYLFFYIYYKKYNSDGIIKPFVISFLKIKGIIKQMKFGAFPLINYLLFLVHILLTLDNK